MTVSQRTIAVELNLSALNSKTEMDPELVAEFSREFSGLDSEVLRWAFREHRKQSPHLPPISAIHALVRQRSRELYDEQEEQRKVRERLATDQARADGKLMDYSEIREQLLALVKRMPEPPSQAKIRQLRERKVAIVVPAMHLSAEQIKSRREADLAEIERATA